MGGMQTGTQKHEVSIVVSTLRPYTWLLKSMTCSGGTHRDAELHAYSVEHKKRERRGRKGMQICVPLRPCVPAPTGFTKPSDCTRMRVRQIQRSKHG